MDISAIQGLSLYDNLFTEEKKTTSVANTATFEALLNSAIGMIQETESNWD